MVSSFTLHSHNMGDVSCSNLPSIKRKVSKICVLRLLGINSQSLVHIRPKSTSNDLSGSIIRTYIWFCSILLSTVT